MDNCTFHLCHLLLLFTIHDTCASHPPPSFHVLYLSSPLLPVSSCLPVDPSYIMYHIFSLLGSYFFPDDGATKFPQVFTCTFLSNYMASCSGFGGQEVACWPLVPEFTGSNLAKAAGFLGQKNPQHAFLRRGSKAVGPML